MGGANLLAKYENSFSLLISSIYREWEWLPWKFGVLPKSYWDDLDNQKRYLDWAAKELGITDYNGWFKMPREVNKLVCFSLCVYCKAYDEIGTNAIIS